MEIAGDTEISGNGHPIMIGHYLKSVIDATPGAVDGDGDPAMALAVPTEQFRTSYTFLVPAEYARNFVSITNAAGGAVMLDGADVSGQFASFASGAFAAARVLVTAGQHSITCAAGCGIEVYGYDDAVSYLFAGGLDLKQIVVD